VASVYIYAPLSGAQVSPDFGVAAFCTIDVPFDLPTPPPPPTVWTVSCTASSGVVTPSTPVTITASGAVAFAIAGAAPGTCGVTVTLSSTPPGGPTAVVAMDSVSVNVVAGANGTGVKFGQLPSGVTPAAATTGGGGATKMQLVVGAYEVADAHGTPLIADLRVAVFTITPAFVKIPPSGPVFPSGKPQTNLVEFDPLFAAGQWVSFLDPAVDYTIGGSPTQSPYLVQMTALDDHGRVLSQTVVVLVPVLWLAAPA